MKRAKESRERSIANEPPAYTATNKKGDSMSKEKLFHYNAAVERVVDGDTIDVTLDLGFDIQLKGRVRFHGMNAPESRTKDPVEKEAGLAAKRYVEDWTSACEGKVIIQTTLDDRGKFGRILGRILNDDGTCLNEEMVQLGHATPYFGGKR
jgi:micrococcal nuclease|tara:strand:+ start:425 stop:877 length:453 start_codon:yes stop_codon:yes gene_type:complete